MIDLEPNYHILSPGAVLERRTNNISDNEPLSNIKLEEPSFTQCFFKGKVRNYEDSSTALSTCGGLCGYIRVKRHTYFIEPVERVQNDTEDQPHVLYEEEQNDLSTHNCATKLTADRSDKNLANSLVRKNMMSTESTPEKEASSRSPNKRLHIETLLVLDRSMMDLHEVDDLQNYALTVFNMAQSLFHDLSTDPPIDLEIVRVIEVEDPKDILNFRQTRQLGTKELQTFSGWQLRINPKDENHPNHHDLAILLTGNDICDMDSCHYVGLAETNGACRPRRQAAICKDNGLMLGYIIAHQIAHTLGVDHDPAERTPEGITSVMSPVITLSPKVWSEESRSSLQSAIKKRLLHCLEDEPASEIKIADILPGVMYDADYQCQQLLTPDARSCTNKGDCQSLACEFEGTSCSNTGVMPAPGTTCDVNKWCFDGACLEAGQRPSAVEGNWGAWSEWSACSRTCGAGVSVSTRECNSPPPMYGGKSCNGNRNRHKICTTEPCDVGSDPFRDVQCAEYNDWVFPEDGQLHQWKGFFVSNGDPCALYCRNEKDVVVSLSPKVKDGTTCYRGTRDICVDGVCRDIPCDLQFDSNSVEDACGVCHGNGTGCKLVTGHMKFKKGTSKILSIPVGTRNIIVEETKHTPSQLIIKNPETNDVINEGKKLGMFNISGSMGWLGMKRPNQGVLEIPEPLAKPVEIWISSEGPQLISYSMGLPSTPRDGKYSWDYIDWSTCMAQCGDSYQETVPKCVEALSGHVEDRYCSQYQKPPIRRRSCNAGICLPRWLVGEWQECGPCPSKEARRFRIVRCIKPRAGSADGTTIVSDKVCPGSRPIGSEACRCIKRQVLYWPSPYRFDMLSNDFKILQKWNKGNKTSKLPEKKVTLMQLENENEESMLKQFKENQQKHHSIFYMPHVLGTRFNFSIPFKRKRQAIKTAIQNHDSLPLFNSNFIDYFPKPGILDLMKTGNKIMGNNFIPTSHAPKLFSLAIPTDDYSLMNLKRLRPISTYDPPPLRFSDENILKLLSQNLPLNKLKQQQSPNRNIKDPFKNLLDIPDPLLNDSVLSPPKEEKKADIIGMLMNEFHNVLATNTLIQPDTKNPTTTDNYISLIQSLSSKPRGSLFESGIQVSKQPLLSHNVSGLDEALSKLQKLKANSEIMNVSNGFINQKLNNLGFNNQRVTEIWAPPSADHEWENLLNAFRRYFFKKQFESKLKSTNEDIFLVSTRPTASNDTSENINPFRFLTMKVTEKLNTLNTWDKLKAYQFFTALANNLHDSLSAVPQNEQELNFDDDTPAQENLFTPWRDNNLETEINKLKANGFFNVINKDIFRFNRSTNSVLNNNLQIFDKPIFSAEDLANINHMSHLQDRSVLVDNINKIDSPEFYQFKNKNKLRPKGAYKDKDKTTPVSGKTIIYTSNSFLKNYLNEFITNFFSNLHNGREKKETLQKSKVNDIRRKERFVQECSTVVTCGRRITGLYAIPAERICPSTKKINRPKYILTRCRKNVAYFPWEKTGVKSSSEEETALARPGKVKIIKKKRHYMPCEESTRVCEELRRLFKDRMKNVTKLDPYECQRLREEIIHARFNLRNEQRLEKDLHNIINTNMTCLFRYSDYKETTTPFPAFNKFVNN